MTSEGRRNIIIDGDEHQHEDAIQTVSNGFYY